MVASADTYNRFQYILRIHSRAIVLSVLRRATKNLNVVEHVAGEAAELSRNKPAGACGCCGAQSRLITSALARSIN